MYYHVRNFITIPHILQILLTISGYLDYTIENMTYYQKLVKSYVTYNSFSNCLQNEKQKLITYYNNFVGLPITFVNENVAYIGVTMKNFYIIYDDDEFQIL